jgi:hypothetical protein
LEFVHDEQGTAMLATPEGSIYVVFQHAAGYERPVWPPDGGRQRLMMHFDFQVTDLDAGVAEAVALGATLAEYQQQEHLRVLFDPAGHPFCLCLDEQWGAERCRPLDPGQRPQAVRGCAERALGASRA